MAKRRRCWPANILNISTRSAAALGVRAAVCPEADCAGLGPLQVAAERPRPKPGLAPKARFVAAGNGLGRAGSELLLVERGRGSLRFPPRHYRQARPGRLAKQTRHRLERVRRGGFRQSLEPPPPDDRGGGIGGGQNDFPLPFAVELVFARPIYVLDRDRRGTASDLLPGARSTVDVDVPGYPAD